MQGALKGWYWLSETVGQASTLFGPFWGKSKVHKIAAGVFGACGAVYQGIRTADFTLPKWGGEAETDEEMGRTVDTQSSSRGHLQGTGKHKGNAPYWAYAQGVGYHILLLATVGFGAFFTVSSAVGRSAEAHGHDDEVFPGLNTGEWVAVVLWSLIQYLFELSNGGVEVLKNIVETHHLQPDSALHKLCLPLRLLPEKGASSLAALGSVAHSADHVLTMAMFVSWESDPSPLVKLGYAGFGIVLMFAALGNLLETSCFEGTISYRNLLTIGRGSNELRGRLDKVKLPRILTPGQANIVRRWIQLTGGPVHGMDTAVPILQALRAVGLTTKVAYPIATLLGIGSGIGNHNVEVVNARGEVEAMTKGS